MKNIYQVCIPHTARDYFDYQAPAELEPTIGARVWVPFRKKIRLGIIVGIVPAATIPENTRFIETLIDESPLLTEELFALCQWISRYYQSPLSEVLPLALPKKYREGAVAQLPMTEAFQLALPLTEVQVKVAPRAQKQQQMAAFLAEQDKPVTKKELQQMGFSSAVLKTLLQLQCINTVLQPQLPPPPAHELQPSLTLNSEQQEALQVLMAHGHEYRCFLLQGVTGSGKTEVYLQLIQSVLQQGKQALVLVPEIGLTPQLVARFMARFHELIMVIHSSLNESERQYAWQLAHEGMARIIIGTRAAVFTPMPSLGIIIIDEEHDLSFKQMEGVRYSARDVALMRAHRLHIPILLGSATPSLETLYNVEQKKYQLLRLTQRAEAQKPLHVQLVDLRAQTLEHGLAKSTLNVIKEHLQQQNQVLIFINRRGFAPVLMCHQCGWMMDCPACDSHLTLHKHQLICHHCGLIKMIPKKCGRCSSDELIPVGAGTQRIHEFLTHYFPQYTLSRVDRDAMRKKEALELELARIQQGKAQLIVGTQMLAKGHHFPRLTLVVVVDADAGLYHQDFRALEHLAQLLTQVAGRAGRAEYPGQVLIQTHEPQHPLLNTLIRKGYDALAQEILLMRRQAQLPPYYYLALIRAQSHDLEQLKQWFQQCKIFLHQLNIEVMGPAPAPLPRKAHQHRMQLLLKSASRKILQAALTQWREWLTINKLNNSVRWNVDIDPVDLS
ncbi:MAG: primosomal protein N' [Legionella sp.]|nr:primosomal protein N' [Legionella sp.]